MLRQPAGGRVESVRVSGSFGLTSFYPPLFFRTAFRCYETPSCTHRRMIVPQQPRTGPPIKIDQHAYRKTSFDPCSSVSICAPLPIRIVRGPRNRRAIPDNLQPTPTIHTRWPRRPSTAIILFPDEQLRDGASACRYPPPLVTLSLCYFVARCCFLSHSFSTVPDPYLTNLAPLALLAPRTHARGSIFSSHRIPIVASSSRMGL